MFERVAVVCLELPCELGSQLEHVCNLMPVGSSSRPGEGSLYSEKNVFTTVGTYFLF